MGELILFKIGELRKSMKYFYQTYTMIFIQKLRWQGGEYKFTNTSIQLSEVEEWIRENIPTAHAQQESDRYSNFLRINFATMEDTVAFKLMWVD